MRFHVVSLPHVQTTEEYSLCAYGTKTRRFCNMMKSLGHKVYLYAGEENEADCDELITVVTKKDQLKWFGNHDYKSKFFNITWDSNDEHWQVMNARAIAEIKTRIKPKDFICIIGGLCQKQIADAFPEHMSVEYGIGYSGTFAKYRVFESYAWMHSVYGAENNLTTIMSAQGKFYDTVIPNYFETKDFPFAKKKDNYYLYIGRLTPLKGYTIAQEVCERLKVPLKVAGQGEFSGYGEYVGTVNPKQRGELMSKAQAVFVPSLYLEPFGGTHVEALMCGTPVITTPWGAFSETFEQGVHGYKCHTFREFLEAAENVKSLDYQVIRDYAVSRFSTDVIKYKYQEYFERLLDLWGEGWYA